MIHKEHSHEVAERHDLWTILVPDESDDRGHFGIVEILCNPDDNDTFRAKVLYTTERRPTPFITGTYDRDDLHAPLPDEDNWTFHFRDLIDAHLDHLTYAEVADLLNGEPAYEANGERGYEALRHSLLSGIHDSITEFSVSHGHGPPRYGRAVEQRIDEAPDWLAEPILSSEEGRWIGGMMDAETASRIVEILELREHYLDEINEDEITELVNEFDLEYDEYIEGHFTAHDCPECGEAIIERPKGDRDYIPLDCSGCDARFEGHIEENALVIDSQVESSEDDQ